MLTQDFILPTNGDWLALPLTSTFTVMNNVSFKQIGGSGIPASQIEITTVSLPL